MHILVTGCAGFIGFHVSINLLINNYKIIGLDNLNDYYDTDLKKNRLKILKKYKNFSFKKIDIGNLNKTKKIFAKFRINYVIHLAAQAGVRYSIKNPDKYFDSNIIGHYNLMNLSKNFKIKHFLFASSSSVYGNNQNYPLKEKENTDFPQSFYAASKKIDEIMTYSFSSVYKLPATGLRFFTVYGPFGRPDMFLYKLVHSIYNRKKIEIYNYGIHERDFTYIDDVVSSILKLFRSPPKKKVPYSIFNIGSNNPVKLKDFIYLVEKNLNKKAIKKNIKLQKGDVIKTHADNLQLTRKTKLKISTKIKDGIKKFIDWYVDYYNL